MSRVLVVAPPFSGHVNPLLGVAAELVRRGHRVEWVADPGVVRGVSPLVPVPNPLRPRPDGLRGYAALKQLWDGVLEPLTAAMVPAVERGVRVHRADLVLADQQAFAGALVAERLGVPHVVSASTSGEFSGHVLPAVREFVAGRMWGLRERYGEPGAGWDLRFSPWGTVAFTSRVLAGGAPSGPTVFAGVVDRPGRGVGFPWHTVDPGKGLVFVTLGTVNSGPRFLSAAREAVSGRADLQVVVADRPVPQLELLDRAVAVVCHGGHNTVCEALARDLPLVVAPIRDDQTVVAGQVVAARAGVRVRFDHARAEHIGAALERVLADPCYRVNAARVGRSLRVAGGAVTAADAVELVLAGGTVGEQRLC